MDSNQYVFNKKIVGLILALKGDIPSDVASLEKRIEHIYTTCNPKAYDPSNPAATFSPVQYAMLFNFGYTAFEDADGEIFYFDGNYEMDALKAQFAYVIADPNARSDHRTQPANQAVLSSNLKLLARAAVSGGASDELALFAISEMEDALSKRHFEDAAVLSDAYREILADILAAFKTDGAGEVVLDRLETLLTTRSETELIVDSEGVARPDKGQWS